MKKIVLTLVALVSAFSLVGCEAYDEAVKEEKANNEIFDSFVDFEVLTDRGTTDYGVYYREFIVVDKNTGVLYYKAMNDKKFSITPIYNADGTLKIYEKDLTK